MAYNTFPSVTRASAPGVANDSSQGFVVGSQWTDTSVAPRKIYLCTDASAGAAVWINAGGVTAHTGLTALGWSASGHTGTTNSVACFSNTGAASNAQATADGAVLTYSGGVIQFLVAAAAITFLSSKTLEIQYAPVNANAIPATSSVVVTGAFV
jgi:hypothetical protein